MCPNSRNNRGRYRVSLDPKNNLGRYQGVSRPQEQLREVPECPLALGQGGSGVISLDRTRLRTKPVQRGAAA